jgi:hypothetical protein
MLLQILLPLIRSLALCALKLPLRRVRDFMVQCLPFGPEFLRTQHTLEVLLAVDFDVFLEVLKIDYCNIRGEFTTNLQRLIDLEFGWTQRAVISIIIPMHLLMVLQFIFGPISLPADLTIEHHRLLRVLMLLMHVQRGSAIINPGTQITLKNEFIRRVFMGVMMIQLPFRRELEARTELTVVFHGGRGVKPDHVLFEHFLASFQELAATMIADWGFLLGVLEDVATNHAAGF